MLKSVLVEETMASLLSVLLWAFMGFGLFLIGAHPFSGASLFGIGCVLGGFYFAWRIGKNYETQRDKWDTYYHNK